MANMRQQFHPQLNASLLNLTKIDPENPNPPLGSSTAKYAVPSKPKGPSCFPSRSESQQHSKKRSNEKSNDPNPHKKSKVASGRRVSEPLDVSANTERMKERRSGSSDGKGLGGENGISKEELPRRPVSSDGRLHGGSKRQTQKLEDMEFIMVKSSPEGRENVDLRPASPTKDSKMSRSASAANKGHVRFSEPIHHGRAASTSESGGSSPSRISSEEEDQHYFGNEDFDDRDFSEFAKHSQIEEDYEGGQIASKERQEGNRGDCGSVIDIGSRRQGTEKPYTVRTLRYSETATWDIPRHTLPITPSTVTAWESTGHELATRAAQLIAECIVHRKDRADLFSRVEKRVKGHRDVLETRNTALNVKHKRTTTQCQTLIQDIETGVF